MPSGEMDIVQRSVMVRFDVVELDGGDSGAALGSIRRGGERRGVSREGEECNGERGEGELHVVQLGRRCVAESAWQRLRWRGSCNSQLNVEG